MTAYEDMEAAELRASLEDWTARSVEHADAIASAIDARDLIRASLMTHAYRQARSQMKRIRRILELGIVA